MKILCLGDSTEHGVDGSLSPDYGLVAKPPSSFITLSGWTVVNAGVDGQYAGAALETFAADVADADVITGNWGINDAKQMDGPEVYRANLNAMIDEARSQGKLFILETPNPTTVEGHWSLADFVAAMRAVAKDRGVPLIDQYRFLYPYAPPGGTHPDQAGYQRKGEFKRLKLVNIFAEA